MKQKNALVAPQAGHSNEKFSFIRQKNLTPFELKNKYKKIIAANAARKTILISTFFLIGFIKAVPLNKIILVQLFVKQVLNFAYL